MRRSTRLLAAMPALALLAMTLASAQPRKDTSDDAAAATQAGTSAAGRKSARDGDVEATRQFLGLGAAPDAAAAGRGKPVYAENCAGCHGPDARGGIGPNLLYSTQVLHDDHGEKLGPWLAVGRPEKGMPPFAQLSEATRRDIAEYLHLQVENYANRGTYKNTNNVMMGDVAAGAEYFAANCTGCHAAAGDLKGVGARYQPLELQRTMVVPAREDHPSRALRAVVRAPDGLVEGAVTKIDDFKVVLVDAGGAVHPFRRGPDVGVTLHDPLAWHRAFAFRLKDRDMTNLVTYLGTLK